jgi:hypothetical protein
MATGITLAVLAWLFVASPAAAHTAPGPVRCRVGAYLEAIYDLDVPNRTFAADLWLWSVCPDDQFTPLTTMEFLNANSISTRLDSTVVTSAGVWSQLKVRGTFRYGWDLTDFPFDRHALTIVLEEGVSDTRSLVYEPDTANSGYPLGAASADWRVEAFRLTGDTGTPNTTFGDPTLNPGEGSAYTQLVITTTIERTDLTSFVKLTFVVYIAFLLSLISYFLNLRNPALLTARFSVISGALFAVAVSLRSATSALSSEEGLTLVDKIHVAALLVILIDAVAALVTQLLMERGRPAAEVTRFDRIVMAGVVVGFVAANAWLIGRAAAG